MKKLLLAGAALLAMAASGAALARVSVDISIGGPDIIYAEPDYYYYYPPVRYVERPRVIVLPERVYRPVPVYRSRYYGEFRGPRYDKRYKHYQRRDYRGHFRDGWHN